MRAAFYAGNRIITLAERSQKTFADTFRDGSPARHNDLRLQINKLPNELVRIRISDGCVKRLHVVDSAGKKRNVI